MFQHLYEDSKNRFLSYLKIR